MFAVVVELLSKTGLLDRYQKLTVWLGAQYLLTLLLARPHLLSHPQKPVFKLDPPRNLAAK